MPICQNCHNEWNWKQTLKALFTANISQEGMKCPYCKESQFISRSSPSKKYLPVIVILFFVYIVISFFTEYQLILFLIFLAPNFLLLIIAPFKTTLSNERGDIH